jgi:diguanylate cyclase (GGDEF)-like protein
LKNKQNTYTKITAKIILSTLFVSLLLAYLYGEYLKKESIENLSKADAKQTSMLIFESLYSAMAKGWTKGELEQIVGRLNNVNSHLKIKVYRAPAVVKDFGDIQKDKEARDSIENLQETLKGKEILNIIDNENIEYYYPVIAKSECITCHVSANTGDVMGIININYPVVDLKISLNQMINFFLYFIVIFSFSLFIILFFEFNRYLLKPIKNFISTINNISNSHDISKRIEVIDDVEEINSMQKVFNNMLDSIEFQFYNDELTKLPNRKKLIEILDKNEYAVLMIINIDNFQQINDLYGHHEGDIILKEFAEFLHKKIDEHSILFKLHSDEYGILSTKYFEEEYINNYTIELIEDIKKQKFNVDSGKSNIFINSTIGIAHGDHSLLTNSDIALKLAKKRKSDYLIYDPTMQAEHEYEQNLKWTKKIKDAIATDKITVLYQPIVDCKDEKIVKYESLMRMLDENGEYIAPVFFLELAKKNKLYHELTKIVIIKTFEKFKNSKYMVSINLTVDDILNKDIYDLIIYKLKTTNIGERISFEIIESDGIENFEKVVHFIDEVKTYGCKISIDDFGTGYSNFEYLMRLKVDFIKIDSSMIKNIDKNSESKMITETIVDFAQKLGIKTVGEFVYSKSIFDEIKGIGVDYAQGYYFGEPKKDLD